MTQGEKISVIMKRLLRPMLLGLVFAVWGLLIYTRGPAAALFSGEWQTNLAGKGWSMTAFYLAMTIGGMVAPLFAIWNFHSGISTVSELRKEGLSAWLARQDREWQAEVRKRSEDRVQAGR